jgi:hypothetical protein
MRLESEFKEFIKLLNENKVEYLLVGGYAVGFHGYPRTTGDIDFWVKPSFENADKIIRCLKQFEFPLEEEDKEYFTKPDKIFQMGFPPIRIDLITTVEGLEFDDCYAKKKMIVTDNLDLPLLSIDDLKANKKAVGRPRDLDDLENLNKQ